MSHQTLRPHRDLDICVFQVRLGGGNDAVSLLLHCDEYLATHKTLPGLSDRCLITPAFPGFVDYWLGGEQLV